uniref:HMG box domain-containing protein n=1 Tax=Romanomermis culicivorax TaxID=13658 RepID=A0A915IGE9_ROMCU
SIEPEASRRWQKLPVELKQVYKTRAREYRTSQEFQNKKREAKSRPHRTRAKAKFDPDEEEKFMRRRDETRSKFKTALTWNLGADVANK